MIVTQRFAWQNQRTVESPLKTRSSICPELGENLRYRSCTLERLGKTPPGEREAVPLNVAVTDVIVLLCAGDGTWLRYLAQRGVLHRHLTQEEVHVVPVVDGMQEVRLCNIKALFNHIIFKLSIQVRGCSGRSQLSGAYRSVRLSVH